MARATAVAGATAAAEPRQKRAARQSSLSRARNPVPSGAAFQRAVSVGRIKTVHYEDGKQKVYTATERDLPALTELPRGRDVEDPGEVLVELRNIYNGHQ